MKSYKYFTKYLPVKGKVQDGDTYIIKDNPSFRIAEGVALKHYDDWDSPSKEENAQKVKLFLCSRDIQVGDKVKIEYNKSGIWLDATAYIEPEWEGMRNPPRMIYAGPDHDMNIGEGYTPINTDTVLKVIGEVLTPGIKEDQEFTEKEAEYLIIK